MKERERGEEGKERERGGGEGEREGRGGEEEEREREMVCLFFRFSQQWLVCTSLKNR